MSIEVVLVVLLLLFFFHRLLSFALQSRVALVFVFDGTKDRAKGKRGDVFFSRMEFSASFTFIFRWRKSNQSTVTFTYLLIQGTNNNAYPNHSFSCVLTALRRGVHAASAVEKKPKHRVA